MPNTTSGTNVFEKTFYIDEIIEESYNRIGQFDMSGYNLKTARRSLNILFSEWGNRGLHYWEVANTNITLVNGTSEYVLFRSTGDGNSNGVTTTLSADYNYRLTNYRNYTNFKIENANFRHNQRWI